MLNHESIEVYTLILLGKAWGGKHLAPSAITTGWQAMWIGLSRNIIYRAEGEDGEQLDLESN